MAEETLTIEQESRIEDVVWQALEAGKSKDRVRAAVIEMLDRALEEAD